MGIVVQAGSINTQSVLAPNVVVQILPPSQSVINGLPTNLLGNVGTATWGPINVPTLVGSMAEGVQYFGRPVPRLYDMMTSVYSSTLNGANAIVCVRVVDGTETASTVDILDITTPTPVIGMIVTAKYTGSLGNSLSIQVTKGSKNGSFKVIIAIPNGIPEIFDNITGTGLALWQNMVDAINNGQTGLRGSSNLIIASIGTAINAPALNSYTPVGGTDGATAITSADMIGVDVFPRTGMYALRGQQCSVGILTDLTDPSTYSTQASFALDEGIYMFIQGAVGQTLAQAASEKNTAGIDNYDVKFLVGDWCTMFDPFNNVNRLVSPQGFAAGVVVNQGANGCGLNKIINGIIGTESTQSGAGYTNADVVFAVSNGLDFIYNPSAGGKYFSLQTGQNTSSNSLIRMDSYTKLTNYLAYSIAGGLGIFIGQLQTPSVRQSALATLTNFFVNLFNQRLIGNVNYPNDANQAFQIILNSSNNPDIRVAEGYMQADIQVVDFSVIRVFLVNLQNGQVSINSVTPVQ